MSVYFYLVDFLKYKYGDDTISGYLFIKGGHRSGIFILLKYQFYSILILIGIIFSYFLYLGSINK